ncbi:Salicylate O-methyltransferase [Tripterygium wilfordii]|uniref:Salicylate O-methyltransferase n=1 Tax=Tripterygium wilfordii TaxID=458696 RepID=A0A7J7CPI7_TRIWF|nr:S-adenosyl-L-methionine:benzoic acid/salicylic acid carboxyl methyltransferase 3-like [Tripterygium wilfordii]KAF5736012.1 Salicylate O-methyltransferase [Tripterygium wilfordii]
MEVVQVLHMNGGTGDMSYANNSLVQQKVISMTKPITEEAITNLYCTSFPTTLSIADLGCSSGPNTFYVVSELIKEVHNISKKLGRKSPEYQVFLNDLPGNDFNTIFRSLSSFHEKLEKHVGPCFFTGVPGSFYGRIFPTKSLHFVHASYSLQWLSQVPEGLEGNKGNIYMATNSPQNVLRAYYDQFQKDFSMFLECRSVELVAGGRMVLTLLGRRSEDPSSKECCYIWELLAMALNDMVTEGIIEEEKFNSFNIPQYTPSAGEVKYEVEKQGCFTIDRLEVSEVNWDAYADEYNLDEGFKDGGYNVAKCMRAVAEPLLVSQFGEEIIDEVFSRYKEIITDRMSKEKTEFVNVIVSVTRNA